MSRRSILVTGSSGFIGRHLIVAIRNLASRDIEEPYRVMGVSRNGTIYPYDLQDHHSYRSFNCDLTQENQVASLMGRYQPDVVFHLAGDPLTKEWGVKTSLSNYLSTHNLLAHAKPGCRFVFASSATVYGTPTVYQGRCDEDHPFQPTSPYGAAKAGSELLIRAFNDAKKVSGLSVRLAATVGSGATHGLVPDVVRKLRSDDTLLLFGAPPGPVKPFTHVTDVVDGLVLLGLDTAVTGAVNLASGDSISVARVADAVMQAVGVHKPVLWSGEAGTWKGDNLRVHVDSSGADWLGWRPKCRNSWEAVQKAARDIDSNNKVTT